jgi:formylglycine-generating enzyme required for sulfatase activity
MQEHQELIAPMTVDELHSAMEKQAAVVGLRFDSTLSDSILAEVKGEPGAMPLLQHALWELWNRRHGLWIKAEEYQAFGGVKQAIASTAEEVYASCSDFERARVRDIFLRLTRLDPDGSGEGRDTRRRVLIEELIPVNSEGSVTINMLDKLADARLIVKTDKDVEVAHEALIRNWSRLTEWLNEDRDNLRLREGVSESAREWENSKRDDSLLNHRGGRLELALAMSKLPRYQLNPIEQAYLNACAEMIGREIEEKQKQQEREKNLNEAKTKAELEKTKSELVTQKEITRRNTISVLAIFILSVSMILAYPIIYGYWLKWQAQNVGELLTISGGSVMLGNDKYFDSGQAIKQQVYEISTFSMEKFEVTNERYSLCVKAGKCTPPSSAFLNFISLANDPNFSQKPVANIFAFQAAQFCSWIDRRLPTEVEWERAARSTDGRIWPWGNEEPTSSAYANLDYASESCLNSSTCSTNNVGTAKLGSSEEDVYDLIGNVAEYTCASYYPSKNSQLCSEPDSWDTKDFRLALRGFGADMQIDNSYPAYIREPITPAYNGSSFVGFRCVKDINP